MQVNEPVLGLKYKSLPQLGQTELNSFIQIFYNFLLILATNYDAIKKYVTYALMNEVTYFFNQLNRNPQEKIDYCKALNKTLSFQSIACGFQTQQHRHL